jgi:hypothetical protein
MEASSLMLCKVLPVAFICQDWQVLKCNCPQLVEPNMWINYIFMPTAQQLKNMLK